LAWNINEAARDVEDPDTKIVWKRLQALKIAQGPAERRDEARSRADLRIDAPVSRLLALSSVQRRRR
jgi:hypothetical protein